MCMFLALAGMAPAQPPVLGIVETGKTEILKITITGVSKATEWTKTPGRGTSMYLSPSV